MLHKSKREQSLSISPSAAQVVCKRICGGLDSVIGGDLGDDAVLHALVAAALELLPMVEESKAKVEAARLKVSVRRAVYLKRLQKYGASGGDQAAAAAPAAGRKAARERSAVARPVRLLQPGDLSVGAAMAWLGQQGASSPGGEVGLQLQLLRLRPVLAPLGGGAEGDEECDCRGLLAVSRVGVLTVKYPRIAGRGEEKLATPDALLPRLVPLCKCEESELRMLSKDALGAELNARGCKPHTSANKADLAAALYVVLEASLRFADLVGGLDASDVEAAHAQAVSELVDALSPVKETPRAAEPSTEPAAAEPAGAEAQTAEEPAEPAAGPLEAPDGDTDEQQQQALERQALIQTAVQYNAKQITELNALEAKLLRATQLHGSHLAALAHMETCDLPSDVALLETLREEVQSRQQAAKARGFSGGARAGGGPSGVARACELMALASVLHATLVAGYHARRIGATKIIAFKSQVPGSLRMYYILIYFILFYEFIH
jgi:hypothetical protein